MVRPETLAVITATATEVGKTWTGAAVAAELRHAGLTVAARKPVQSFEPGAGPTDAEVLASATGERPDEVCPPHRWYGVAVAPPMAAARLGVAIPTIDELVSEIAWPAGVAVGLLEGVGGPRSPLAADGDTVDLCDRVRADVVVLVADAGLGVINAVRLSATPFTATPVVVFLNRFDASDDLHRDNGRWLADDGYDVCVTVAEVAGRLTGRGRSASPGP